MLVGGPDTWHPNAEMFYRAGGGPLLDIAPYYLTAIVSLLGPITKVAGFARDTDAGAHARRRPAVGRGHRASMFRPTRPSSCSSNAAGW